MAPANWSELPPRIDVELDLIRFRSVCSNWRFSSIPNHHCNILPFKFPLLKPLCYSDASDNDSINNPVFDHLYKQNFFLIKPPPPPQQQQQTLLRPWLIRICENSVGKTLLFHPLLRPVPRYTFNLILDLNKFFLLHLGSNFISFENHPYCMEYMYHFHVIAVTSYGKKPLVLGMFKCIPGPSLLKCGDEDWKVMTEISGSMGDICIFKGRPYMVDETGRTVTVEPDSSVQLMDESLVIGGHMKFLVECEGDLLLADVYECVGVRFPDHDPVRIDFFKLDEKEKKWVKLTSLGDTVVLFLGMAGSFSVSASDLCVSKGNCVIFMNNILEPFPTMEPVGFVLDLNEGQLTRLSDSPEYSNLFWPPPEWIVNS